VIHGLVLTVALLGGGGTFEKWGPVGVHCVLLGAGQFVSDPLRSRESML
jgi:hypothetical protein